MVTAAQLAALIRDKYSTPWAEGLDSLYTNAFLLTRIRHRSGGGASLDWPVLYAGNDSAGSYGENDDGVGTGKQTFARATLPWRLNKVEIGLSGLADAISATGGTIIDLKRTEIEQGLRNLRAKINTQLMSDGTGNSGLDLTGLFAAIADTGVYAGIDRAVSTWWKAYVLENSGTPRALTEELMREAKSTVEDRGGRVTAIYSGSRQYYAYGDILRSERRQMVPQTLTGGYQALDFEGIPLIKVPGYPSTRMDFVDEEQIEYVVLKDFDPIPMARVKDVEEVWIRHYSQLKCMNPYQAASIQDLDDGNGNGD